MERSSRSSSIGSYEFKRNSSRELPGQAQNNRSSSSSKGSILGRGDPKELPNEANIMICKNYSDKSIDFQRRTSMEIPQGLSISLSNQDKPRDLPLVVLRPEKEEEEKVQEKERTTQLKLKKVSLSIKEVRVIQKLSQLSNFLEIPSMEALNLQIRFIQNDNESLNGLEKVVKDAVRSKGLRKIKLEVRKLSDEILRELANAAKEMNSLERFSLTVVTNWTQNTKKTLPLLLEFLEELGRQPLKEFSFRLLEGNKQPGKLKEEFFNSVSRIFKGMKKLSIHMSYGKVDDDDPFSLMELMKYYPGTGASECITKGLNDITGLLKLELSLRVLNLKGDFFNYLPTLLSKHHGTLLKFSIDIGFNRTNEFKNWVPLADSLSECKPLKSLSLSVETWDVPYMLIKPEAMAAFFDKLTLRKIQKLDLNLVTMYLSPVLSKSLTAFFTRLKELRRMNLKFGQKYIERNNKSFLMNSKDFLTILGEGITRARRLVELDLWNEQPTSVHDQVCLVSSVIQNPHIRKHSFFTTYSHSLQLLLTEYCLQATRNSLNERAGLLQKVAEEANKGTPKEYIFILSRYLSFFSII